MIAVTPDEVSGRPQSAAMSSSTGFVMVGPYARSHCVLPCREGESAEHERYRYGGAVIQRTEYHSATPDLTSRENRAIKDGLRGLK